MPVVVVVIAIAIGTSNCFSQHADQNKDLRALREDW